MIYGAHVFHFTSSGLFRDFKESFEDLEKQTTIIIVAKATTDVQLEAWKLVGKISLRRPVGGVETGRQNSHRRPVGDKIGRQNSHRRPVGDVGSLNIIRPISATTPR